MDCWIDGWKRDWECGEWIAKEMDWIFEWIVRLMDGSVIGSVVIG
jgi:hypothetical protein